MDNEDLSASHWDDVYTGSDPSPFQSKLPNILQSDEFAPPSYDDDDDDDDDGDEDKDKDQVDEENQKPEQHHESYDYSSHTSNFNPADNTDNDHQAQINHHLHPTDTVNTSTFGDYNDPSNQYPTTTQSPVSTNFHDNASTEATKSINNEATRAKNQNLLSSLTKDIEDDGISNLANSAFGTISQTVNHVGKDDSLFNVMEDNKFNDFSAGTIGSSSSGDHHQQQPAKKYNSLPVKMYRAPRVRRNKLATTTSKNGEEKSSNTPENGTVATKIEGTENLGPLGEALNNKLKLEEKESNTKDAPLSRGAKLVQEVDAPLYNLQKPSQVSPTHKSLTDNPELSNQIGDFFSKKQQEKMEQRLTKPEPEGVTEKLEVYVGDPTKVGDITSAHIVYTVRAATESNLLNSSEVVVTRRYKDFRWLYHQLQSNNPGYIIPPPPLKQAVGRFNEQFIESRRFALEKMLQKISVSPVLQKDPDFLMFLQSNNFSNEAKEREKLTGSGASSAGDDYDMGGSSGSGSGAGGFMSALGGAFSFTAKVTDQDDFFLDQKAYVEDLDMYLKSFYKNFELIVQQRNELSNVTEEFANAVQSLADIETSKDSNNLLSAFSHTHHRIKELLERQSMQDLITLGSVLDEYIRILGSIRAVFAQRHKALVASTNSEHELSKKQVALEKFTRNYRNQVDKIEAMKNEVASYETKSSGLKQKFEELSATIKKELNRFEFEKIEDFRNAVETFLESLIESQKEAIELWETFYEREKLDEVDNINFEETDS
ncbi:sorting nexin 1 [Saccharomycopsis crataegensis]|uniref:Sorting nexin 1 n=1 Tax=Saccharomycopsis crataegensis TaxID=43959 RepID=A0AAV5QGV7_9ASCO|nr:sorting nexin 1 [Saccharomycopsis crataegensis]